MKKKIAVVVAAPMTINFFLKDQVIALSKIYDVTIICNAENSLEIGTVAQHVRFIPIDIRREIAPWSDLRALWSLFKVFRQNNYEIVHSVTPKAGLLAMLAALFARTPIRVHMFTGQVWATRYGVSRLILKTLDKVIAWSATILLVDSASQRDYLIKQGIVSKERSMVLAKGSISGVDLQRFHLDQGVREKIRLQMGLGTDAVAVLFLGRLKKDKGIIDLAQAFSFLGKKFEKAHLVIVGPDEDNLQAEMEKILSDYGSHLHFVPQTNEPENFMMACDIFCLPSYREGFGSVVIEAAACRVPAVGSRIYGVTDAIVENETGLLFNPGDITDLTNTLEILLNNSEKRLKLGKNALTRVHLDFSREYVTRELLKLYESKLRN